MHLRSLAVGLMMLLALGSQANAADPKYKWRMTTFVPESNQIYIDYVKPFIDRVHLLTSGEVEIKGFGAGVIAGAFEGYQAVQKGTADLALLFPAFIVNQNPANAMYGGFPAGMSGEGFFSWLFEGDGEKLWIDLRRETMDLHPVIAGIGPTEIFAHSRRPLRVREDLKGLKIRTAGAWVTIMQEFGASPTVAPPGELFTMLERGALDATEFASPSMNHLAGYHNVAKYVVVPGIHSTSFAYEVVFKRSVWDALPDDLRQKIRLAGRLVASEGYIRTMHKDIAAMEAFMSGKNEMVELDPKLLKEMSVASHRWADRTAKERAGKGDNWMKKIYGSYAAYQKRWNSTAIYRWVDGKYD